MSNGTCDTVGCRRKPTHRLHYSFPESRGKTETDLVCEPCGRGYLRRPALLASMEWLVIPGDTVRTGLVIERIDYLPSTSNANPRGRVHFTDETDALIMSDAACASGIGNVQNTGVPLTVTFTRAGRIRFFTREDREAAR